MRRLVLLAAFAAAVLSATAPALGVPAHPLVRTSAPAEAYVSAGGAPQSAGVIVRFKSTQTAPLAAELLSAATSTTAQVTNRAAGLYTFSSPVTATDEQYAIQLMLASPGVAFAEPNYLRHIEAYAPPTDPDFTDTQTWYETVSGGSSNYFLGGKHWWLDAMNAPAAWAIGQGTTYPEHGGASSIKVGVIDTGMYLTHPEFSGGTVTAGKDENASFNPANGALTTDMEVTPDATSDVDYQSHGTGTTAAIGAEVNGVGMVGIGWNPTVLGYKVAGPLTQAAYGYPAGTLIMPDSAIINAIYDATNAGCKVINISLGGTDYSQAEQDAVTYAHSQGTVICASAGNDGGAVVNYPAAYTNVVAVAAVTRVGGSSTTNGAISRASFSDYGAGVNDLTAPGEVFWTADKPGYVSSSSATSGLQFWAGTSFSSPAAVGAIAYVWRAMPDLSADQIVSYVESSAVDLGTPGRDDSYGYGLVDMQAAYNKMIADYPMLASPTIAANYVRPSDSVTWTPSPGYNVGYLVSVDGVLRSTQTSTSYSMSGLSDGSHLISVLPTSTRNWNTSSLGSKTVTVDSVAPVVSNFALAGSSISWSVAEANPYTVQAYVDTATPSVLATNSLAIGTLAAGSHTLHVNATDAAGNSSGWVAWPFTYGSVPPASPVVPSVVVTDALSATVSWPAVGGATSYGYTVNGGSELSTAGPGFALGGLTGGVFRVAVRSVAGTLTSGWSTATVTDNVVVPGLPAISAPATVGVPSVIASWTAAPNALSYEVRLNGGSSVATTSASATLAGLALGTNNVSVRSLDNLAQSAWATVSVTYSVPAPVVSAPATVWASTATVSWSAVSQATSYEFAVDGGVATSTTSTGALVGGLVLGANSVTVRALQGANASAWTTAAIAYSPPSPTTLSLSPSAVTVQDPESSALLTAYLAAPAETLRVQSSADGLAWSDTGVTLTTTATPAPVAISVPVTATSYFRLVFAGDNRWAPATSGVTTATYVSIVQTPIVASFTVTDTLSATVSWPAISGAASYDYTVNGSSLVNTPGASFVATGLAVGANTLSVRTVNSTAHTSAWVTATVTVALLVPADPQLSLPATVGVPSVSASWPAVTGALLYEYRFDGGTASSTIATGVTLPLPATGEHTVAVRALDNLSASAWVSATVTYQVPAPQLAAPASVRATTVSWPAVPGASGYEYALDATGSATTTATSVVVNWSAYGDHTVAVRTLQGANASAWSTATITYLAPGSAAISLTVTPSRVTYPAIGVGLTAFLGAPNESVRVQKSVDGGATWVDSGITFETAATPVPLTLVAPMLRSTSWRLVFAGDSVWDAENSAPLAVPYAPHIQTPKVPSSVLHRRKFSVSVVLTQPAADSAASVSFQFQRWQKVSGKYAWVAVSAVRAKGAASGGNATTFKASTSLSKTGSWRVVANYGGGSLYANTSANRGFKVR